MNDPEPVHGVPQRRPSGSGDLFVSIISGGLFLYVGFGLGLVGVSGNALYDGSVTALVWGARLVGIGILATAAMSYFRVPGAAALDLLVCVVAAAGCVVVGLIWLAFSDMQGILLLLFGALNGSAVRGAWQRWQLR